MTTTDLHPELTPMERHIAFLESVHGTISQSKYFELLQIYFDKETKGTKKVIKQVTNNSIINKIKQVWQAI